MQSLVISVVVASVFTLGGHMIMRAERHADVIGVLLGLAFAVCALLTTVLFVDRFSEPASYAPTNHRRIAQRSGPALVAAPVK